MTQPNEELKPYTVEVDDHSDDCGTVYRLKGPNVGILSKDEELLKERAEDFNLGFEMGRRSQEAPQGERELVSLCGRPTCGHKIGNHTSDPVLGEHCLQCKCEGFQVLVRDYTPEEALIEANKRWGGKNAVSVECYLSQWDDIDYDKIPKVGKKYKVSGIYKNQEFEGSSFREAFLSADKAEADRGGK